MEGSEQRVDLVLDFQGWAAVPNYSLRKLYLVSHTTTDDRFNHCSTPPSLLRMAFQNATGASIQSSAFYDIGGHQIHGNEFNIGHIVQISNTGTKLPRRFPAGLLILGLISLRWCTCTETCTTTEELS